MKFSDYLLGPTPPPLFLACLLFAALGIFLVLLLGTRLRDKNSPYSPAKFDWNYLFSDNAKRIYASILAVVITLRFLPELTGWELDPWKALCVGTAWDGILLWIKQKTSILDPKKP
jgi:hypothetical protein